jgi:imidazolonepropionase-like amidohydrolase
VLSTLAVLGAHWAAAGEPYPGAEAEVAAARAVFERNLDAIRRRDRETYLATYLEAETLARTGPEGPVLGFASHAAAAGEGWPDVFEGRDLELVPVVPGVVYGTYRYRVRYGADEQAGLSERLFVSSASGWKIAVTSAFAAPPGTPAPPRVLLGATLVDGTGAAPVPDAVVVIRGGKIDCAGSRAACPVPEGIETTDLAGHWITPGLIDAHVHFSQTGWADGRPDALDLRRLHPYAEVQARLRATPERFLRAYLCSGVTAVFDVGGYPWTLDLAARSEADALAPRIRAAGPLLSTIDHWLNLPAERQFIHLEDAEAAGTGVGYLRSRGSAAVKVWLILREQADLAASEAAVLAAGQEAKRAGLPLIVHATGLAEAKVALRAGAAMLVHSVWDQPVDEEFIALAREAGTIYCPTLTVMRGYLRMYEAVVLHRPVAIDDPGGCVDAETRANVEAAAGLEAGDIPTPGLEAEAVAERRRRSEERERVAAANLKRLFDAGIPVAMGTDAGNPLTLHGPAVYAELEAMQAAGLAPMEVLVTATRGGARALGRETELGTVEAGKLADLLVLRADPTASAAGFRQLSHVVRGGVLRAAGELRAAGLPPPN